MRRKMVAAAAACMVATGANAVSEQTNLVRVLTYVVTATGAVKAILEAYDWVRERWFLPPQQFKENDVWHCERCGFPPPGGAATPLDDSRGSEFIAQQFPGRTWYPGQALILCDSVNCFTFRYDGSAWYATGSSFADPGVGYANRPRPPSNHAPNHGAERPPSVSSGLTPSWSPQHYVPHFEPPLPLGTVDVIWGGGITHGGGGGPLRMPTWQLED